MLGAGVCTLATERLELVSHQLDPERSGPYTLTALGRPSAPAPIIFNPLYILASFVKDKVSIHVWIYL